ncbi:MAG: oligosaccharide flippase family protein [Dehalococcoidia bacterium]|nr:oligosaccharide flippase family protein [Dehalococcoidia bacterium]
MNFTVGTAITTAARIGTLLLGLVTSVVVARVLGPEGNGVYTLAVLLPSLIVSFTNLGIAQATVHFAAKKRYSLSDIAGNSLLCAAVISLASLAVGLMVVEGTQDSIFSSVAPRYLLLGLATIPGTVLASYLSSSLLGANRLMEYNLTTILQGLATLALMVIALLWLQAGVSGALLAVVFSAILTNVIQLRWVRRAAGGIAFRPRATYFRQVATYGAKAHVANMLTFLNYRIDMLMVNGLLNPAAVGLYAVGVALAEQLWLVSQAASTVLFPRVSAETNSQRLKEFTPLVSRTVLIVTSFGALVVFVVSRWVVELLYTHTYLASVAPLQILLPGIVALGVSRVLANDMSGRGRPELNLYVAVVTVVSNVVLNALWIPRLGIAGAALASSVSYSVSFAVTLWIYCRISTNSWATVLLPQRGDWNLYRETVMALVRNLKARGRS